jgi:hypothetical protein
MDYSLDPLSPKAQSDEIVAALRARHAPVTYFLVKDLGASREQSGGPRRSRERPRRDDGHPPAARHDTRNGAAH